MNRPALRSRIVLVRDGSHLIKEGEDGVDVEVLEDLAEQLHALYYDRRATLRGMVDIAGKNLKVRVETNKSVKVGKHMFMTDEAELITL